MLSLRKCQRHALAPARISHSTLARPHDCLSLKLSHSFASHPLCTEVGMLCVSPMVSTIKFLQRRVIPEIALLIGTFRAIGRLLASRYTTDKAVHDALIPVAERRLEERAQQKLGHSIPTHVRTPSLQLDPG